MEFRPPIDDIIASLNAVGADGADGWDEDAAREIAGHFGRFARERLAPLNASGDREGCRLENGRVRTPAGFREAYAQYAADGWPGLTAPEEYGGQGMSPLYLAIVSEIFSGANQALQSTTGLVPGAIRTLVKSGTEEQKARYIPKLASGEMISTMCLTEPGAGSDLAAIRTKAVPAGGAWAITGEKVFITSGDQDLSDDAFHLVLARTSEDGLKGLSLFLVEGRVEVARIEEKMGQHAAPTCQLVFDGRRAEMVGEAGQGLAGMFTMMNHARIDVALQGVAQAARAADIARRYAAERKQGGATIDRHPDVARMLAEADHLAKSSRMMAHLALVLVETGADTSLADFMTSLVKVHGSESGMRAAETAAQVLGGYGYLHEYGVEQIYRDARITAIYEGANGIHTRAMATRGVKTGGVAGFEALLEEKGAEMAAWREARSLLEKAGDPLQLAHDFARVAALTLADALLPDPRTRAMARAHAGMMGS